MAAGKVGSALQAEIPLLNIQHAAQLIQEYPVGKQSLTAIGSSGLA